MSFKINNASVSEDLSNLLPGKYRSYIEDEDRDTFVSCELTPSNKTVVIEAPSGTEVRLGALTVDDDIISTGSLLVDDGVGNRFGFTAPAAGIGPVAWELPNVVGSVGSYLKRSAGNSLDWGEEILQIMTWEKVNTPVGAAKIQLNRASGYAVAQTHMYTPRDLTLRYKCHK